MNLLGWSRNSGSILLILPTIPVLLTTMAELDLLPITALSPGHLRDSKMSSADAFISSADIIVMTSSKLMNFFGLLVEDGKAVVRYAIRTLCAILICF